MRGCQKDPLLFWSNLYKIAVMITSLIEMQPCLLKQPLKTKKKLKGLEVLSLIFGEKC